MNKKLRFSVVLLTATALSACQSIDSSGKLSQIGRKMQSTVSGLFAPRIDKLERLVSEGKYDEAERMLEKHASSFDKAEPSVRDRADSVRAALLWQKFKTLAEQGNDEPAQALVAQNSRVADRFTADQKGTVTAVDQRIAKAKLKALVNSGQMREALEFAQTKAARLSKDDPEIASLKSEAANRYSQTIEADARKALVQAVALDEAALTEPERWQAIGSLLKQSKNLESEAKRLDAAGLEAPPVLARFDSKASELRARLVQLAPAAFARHALAGSDKAFESAYPVDVPKDLAASVYPTIEQQLYKADAATIQRFADRYAQQLGNAQQQSLAKLYADRLMAANGKSGPVAELLLAEKLKAVGLPAPTWTERAAFVRLEADESHDGKVSVTPPPSAWMVIQARPGEVVERVASLPELAGRDVAILVRITPPKISAETISRQTMQSRVQAGVQQVPNAKRVQLAQQLAAARQSAAENEAQMQQLKAMDYGNSRAAANLGLLGMLVTSVGATSSQGDVASLSARLASEPTTLSEPVYRNYRFAVDTRRVRKTLNVEWQLVELKCGRRIAGRETIDDQNDFTVAVGVDQNDENARDIFAKHKDERDVQLYAQEQIRVPYADLWGKVAKEVEGRW